MSSLCRGGGYSWHAGLMSSLEGWLSGYWDPQAVPSQVSWALNHFHMYFWCQRRVIFPHDTSSSVLSRHPPGTQQNNMAFAITTHINSNLMIQQSVPQGHLLCQPQAENPRTPKTSDWLASEPSVWLEWYTSLAIGYLLQLVHLPHKQSGQGVLQSKVWVWLGCHFPV